jgi:hypothetical protein
MLVATVPYQVPAVAVTHEQVAAHPFVSSGLSFQSFASFGTRPQVCKITIAPQGESRFGLLRPPSGSFGHWVEGVTTFCAGASPPSCLSRTP